MLAATDRYAERTNETLANVASINPRHVEQLGAAWQRWLNKWGAEFSERDDGRPLLVKLDEVADTLRSTDRCHVAAILAAGLEAWSLTGRDPGRFRRAKVRYESPDRGGRVTGVVESLLAAADGRPSAPAPPTG